LELVHIEMANSTSVAERIEEFMIKLSPEAVAMLVGATEKSRKDGEDDPVSRIILQAALNLSLKHGKKVPRLVDPSRLLFGPIEPFLIDFAAGPKQPARIERASLPIIWTWLERDLMADHIAQLEAGIAYCDPDDEAITAEKLTTELRRKAAAAISAIFDSFQERPDERLRFASQLGSEQALDDANDMVAIFEHSIALQQLNSKLPTRIPSLDGDILVSVTEALGNLIDRDQRLRPFGLVLVMAKLQNPAEIIRVAKAAVNSDSSTKLESHPYRAAVDLVLYEANTKARQAQDALRAMDGNVLIWKLLHDYYSLAHGLNVEVEISSASQWAKKVIKMRSGLSDRISGVIGDAPRQIKALLSYDKEKSKEIPEHEVLLMENLLKLMIQCRKISSELALNEMLSSVRKDSEQYLNMMGDALVEKLRHSDPASRAPLIKRLEIAERLTRIALGDEIADLLRRSASLAKQSIEAEDLAPEKQSA
jgi:hypothetical protein